MVTNDRGSVAVQDFTINVDAPNSAPIITSTPLSTVAVDEVFRYDLVAQDAEQALLSYVLKSGPTGASMSAQGALTWQPTSSVLGQFPFEVVVSDGQGAQTTQRFNVQTLAVRPNEPPEFRGRLRSQASVGRLSMRKFGQLTQMAIRQFYA